MKFTRRHARALATGAAATAAYLAGAKMGDSRAIRGGALLTLAAVATIGRVQASAVAKTTKKRLDTHIGATSDAVHLVAHGGTISGALTVSSLSTGGGSINTSGGSVTCGSITCGHISATQIGPGSDRALLGAGATLAQVQARCDYLLQQLEGANICY